MNNCQNNFTPILTHCISVYANSSFKNLAKYHDTEVIGSISKYLAKYHYTKMGVLGLFPKIGPSIMILKWGVGSISKNWVKYHDTK